MNSEKKFISITDLEVLMGQEIDRLIELSDQLMPHEREYTQKGLTILMFRARREAKWGTFTED